MIPKSQMYLGARIVENDPEEETPVVPYKGTVTAIEETGKGELDYFHPEPEIGRASCRERV